MTAREVRIPVRDGITLAATLYLPDPAAGPQPCLLEALPYRKDDLTSSYAAGYEDLRDRFGFAVCRLDVRGTGSSSGDATDEYPPAEQADLVEVVAWLAAQEWCNGRVGMFGTSYSGFNSLQIACEDAPALGAVFAIYASDDRWTDDVHWRGGALKLVDLVDYCHYMTPMCVLPPVPAVWGDGVGRGVAAPARDQPALGAALAARGPARRLLAGRFGAARRPTAGLPADHGADDAGRRLGRRLPQQLVPHDGRARRERRAAPTAGRSVGARRPAHRDAGAADRPRRRDGGVVRPVAADVRRRRAGAYDSHCDVFVRTSTEPEPDLDLHEGCWVRLPSVPPTQPVVVELAGPRSLAVRPHRQGERTVTHSGSRPLTSTASSARRRRS